MNQDRAHEIVEALKLLATVGVEMEDDLFKKACLSG